MACVRIAAACFTVAGLLVSVSCGKDSAAPVQPTPTADINGTWDWTERITDAQQGVQCNDTGSFVITQSTGTFTGAADQVGICTGPSGSVNNDGPYAVTSGRIAGTTLSFQEPGCTYSGTVQGNPPNQITGQLTCGSGTGTWSATRAAPVASVTLLPPVTRMVVKARLPLVAALTDGTGRRIFLRPVVWSADNPPAATVSTSGVVTGVSPGSVRITGTVEGKSATSDITVEFLLLTSLGPGVGHTCGVLASGVAYCWGFNGGGQGGNGTQVPQDSFPVVVAGGLRFTSVSAGTDHTCGVEQSGAAYCWGFNLYGRLGDGTVTSVQTTPGAVSGGLAFTAVQAGDAHSCGLTTGSLAYCWGDDSFGELGTGATSTTPQTAPVQVTGGLTFASVTVSAGSGRQTCGLAAAGKAYCWGLNASGQLGDSTATTAATPVPVAGGLTFASLSAGTGHTCGVTIAGSAYCWGLNAAGQLGDGTTTDRHVPTAVSGGLSFASVSAGDSHSCGVTTNGAAYCWGANDWGQLGNGSTNESHAPTSVAGGLTFTSVISRGFHACGIASGGLAYCWGVNLHGMLGNGSTVEAHTPVLVVGQQ